MVSSIVKTLCVEVLFYSGASFKASDDTTEDNTKGRGVYFFLQWVSKRVAEFKRGRKSEGLNMPWDLEIMIL